ncbi:MAG: KamA family radical SAM protein [Waddliaceae bacterium]
MSVIHRQPHWRQIQRQNLTSWAALADFLGLDQEQRKHFVDKPRFPLNLPLRLANKIEKGTLEDPILKQFAPSLEELQQTPGFVTDPVGDQLCRRGGKLLHKYKGRVLLVCTSACVMHCRFCFRQNFDYEVNDKTFADELDAIQKDPSIHEVILSGGDPLSLSDRQLGSLLDRLQCIPHIRRLRFHSRFPLGIPERIDAGFLHLMEQQSQTIFFVIHCNHPRELDKDVFASLNGLQRLGIQVLNQHVLLRGVNDNIETLRELCETLIDHGILPYYMHQLDRVQGSAHFEVPQEEGLRLIEQLMTLLPGYGVPKYVREIPQEMSKTPIYPPNQPAKAKTLAR